MTHTLGIDVSTWQDDNSTPQKMDFMKSKAGGVEFVFIKASQANWIDGDLLDNWVNAKAAGLLRGAYHYLVWDKPYSVQASTFLGAVQSDLPELMLVVDYEKRSGVISAGSCRLMLKNTLEYLKARTSCKIGIYTSPGFWAEFGSADVYWAQYPLWLAHYTNDPEPRIPKPWSDYIFWQWTDKGPGKALGAESFGLDMNWFNGSREALYTWAGHTEPELALTWQQSIDAWARTQGYNGPQPEAVVCP